MRRLAICFFSLVLSVSAYAEQTGLMIPVKIEQQKSAVSIDPVQESTFNPNALDILRLALNQEAAKEHENSEKNGVLKSTTMRFPKESLTFFIASGLVIAETMWSKSHGDPMAMERHILSLKDPLANLSFYSFMVANGYTMHIRTKGLPATMDAQTRAQMARRFSYEGMVWGSLASGLISDVFGPFMPCLNKRFSDYRFTKDLEEKCTQGLNSAWAQWNLRGKFNQYAPQILSLLISQKAAELLDAGVSKGASKISKSEIAQRFLQKDSAKKFIFKITGGDVALMIFPGTLAVKSIGWVGKLTQFAGFLAVDHMLSSTVYRVFNNLWKPLAFDFDALKIHRLWNAADDYGWNEKAALDDKLTCPVQVPNCHKFDELPKEIENFSAQTQQWRDHLNATNEQDLAGWMELSKKLLNQISLSYSFYKYYVDNLFDTLNVNYRIKNEGLNPTALYNNTLYPYRQLPLYGIKLLAGTENKKISAQDQYYQTPQSLETNQVAHILFVLSKVNEKAILNYSEKAQKIWSSISTDLKSNDLYKMGHALVLLNTVIGIYGPEKQQAVGVRYEPKFVEEMKRFREFLGEPLPVLYDGAGFSQAHAINSGNLDMAREANFSWSGSTYRFNKDADYLTYQMICGPSKGDMTNNWVFSDNFIPPKIIIDNNKPVQICNKVATYISSSNLYSVKLTNENTKLDAKNITTYITNYINPSVLGDFKNKDKKADFDKWWLVNVKESVRPKFSELDKKFQILVNKNYDVMFGTNNSAETFADNFGFRFRNLVDNLNQSDYLPKTLLDSFKWELEVYLDIIQSTVNKTKFASNGGYYLKLARSNSLNINSNGIYGVRDAEISKLKKEFDIYFSKLNQSNMTFEDYNLTSKKIREQLDSVKILTGLSTKVATKESADNKNEQVACTSDSTFDLTAKQDCEIENTTPKFEITEVDPKTFNLKQRSALAAINGINQIESEVRRFIRMKLLMSQTLDLDTKEFMSDIGNSSNQPKSKIRSASIRGE